MSGENKERLQGIVSHGRSVQVSLAWTFSALVLLGVLGALGVSHGQSSPEPTKAAEPSEPAAVRLVNWTLSGRRYGVELPVTVARGIDPQKVIGLLERVASAHPLVSREPPPEALVVKLGPDSLGFNLRAWTDHAEQWMQIRSELAIAVNAALAEEKIAIR